MFEDDEETEEERRPRRGLRFTRETNRTVAITLVVIAGLLLSYSLFNFWTLLLGLPAGFVPLIIFAVIYTVIQWPKIVNWFKDRKTGKDERALRRALDADDALDKLIRGE